MHEDLRHKWMTIDTETEKKQTNVLHIQVVHPTPRQLTFIRNFTFEHLLSVKQRELELLNLLLDEVKSVGNVKKCVLNKLFPEC